MHYYTYKVEHAETNEYYFGSRISSLKPSEDVNYLGSPVVWNPDKSKLVKSILGEWEDQKEALIEEAKLIRKNIKDPLNRNYHIPNIKFNLYKRTSKKWLIETYGEEKGIERYNNICQKRVNSRRINVGYSPSKETKEKIKNTLKCNIPWNKGEKLTEDHINNIKKTWHSEKRMKLMSSKEYKNKMSVSLSGDNNPMKGKSFYDIWVSKYGKDIANQKLQEYKDNKKKNIALKKLKSSNNKINE